MVPTGGNHDSQALDAGEAFVQEQESQHYVHQWVDEIPQAGCEYPVMSYRPDEDQPVEPHQQSGQQQGQDGLARQQHPAPEVPAIPEQQEYDQYRDRPNNAMGDYFKRRDCSKQLEIDWRQAPEHEGCRGGHHTQSVVRF